MTDAHAANGTIPQPVAKKAFPVVRLLYSLGFAVLAWLAFWMLLVLGTVQFVVLLGCWFVAMAAAAWRLLTGVD